MGGRGGSSGKAVGATGGGSSKGVGASKGSSGAKMGGAGGVGTQINSYTQPKTPISKMSDKKLRSELEKAAGNYYASGKSGISFGKHDPYQVAATLASQKMSRSRMEKEYKSILKRLNK